MKIGIFISTLGGSPLLDGLMRGWAQLGHTVVAYREGDSYDLLAVFNQCAHDPTYIYPPFPTGNDPVVFIDSAEYGYFKRLPGVAEQYANTFSEGSMAHDTKSRAQQERLMHFLEGRSFPYFIREYLKFLKFPGSYHPIDYPLYHHSVCNVRPDREEYLARVSDLFVSWGLSHPWRANLTQVLRESHVCCEIKVLEENGTPRMPQHEFLNKTRQAKCSVSFDGYGSSSFRLTEVIVRCLLLKGPMYMHRHRELEDGVHCVEYSVTSNEEEYLGTDLRARLREVLADPERSFRIYEAGYHHCMQHYTEIATAQYVLDTVEKHDWSKPTPIHI